MITSGTFLKPIARSIIASERSCADWDERLKRQVYQNRPDLPVSGVGSSYLYHEAKPRTGSFGYHEREGSCGTPVPIPDTWESGRAFPSFDLVGVIKYYRRNRDMCATARRSP